MSKRKLILLIAAAFVAMVTVMVARSMMGPQQEAASPPPVKTTEVLAAARDLPIGTILKEMDMKWIPWASDSDTSQFYLKGKDDMGRLIGAVLRDGMRAGEPFLTGHVVQPHDHGFLAAVLEPGKRAMAITLSPSSEVAGFIFPGDHVDVILTHSFSRKDMSDNAERRVSETILSDVRVLALDQKSDSMSADPKVAQLATLEVTSKQAEKLALAADIVGTGANNGKGSLSLVLRSLAAEDLPDGAPAAAQGAAIAPAPAPPQGDAEAIHLAPLDPEMGDADSDLVAMPAKPQPAQPSPLSSSTTWDSDVSPAYPGVNGSDGLMQRVHIMRGKDSTDSNFARPR